MKLVKSVNTTPVKGRGVLNYSHSRNISVKVKIKVKGKGEKDKKFCLQNKWKLKASKEEDSQTNNMNKKT